MSRGRYVQNDSQTAPRHLERPEQGQNQTRGGQPDVEQGDGAMAVTGDDQPLIEVGAVGGEDVFAVVETAEEGERGVEDEGPDEQHPGYDQQAEVADEQVAVAQRTDQEPLHCECAPGRMTATTRSNSASVMAVPEGRHKAIAEQCLGHRGANDFAARKHRLQAHRLLQRTGLNVLSSARRIASPQNYGTSLMILALAVQ